VDASAALPLHLNGEYFGPVEVSRSGFLYKQVGAGSRCTDSAGVPYSRLQPAYAFGLGECMDSCNAFALGTCHGVGFQDAVGCVLYLEAGAGSSDAPGLNRQVWTLINGTGTGPVAASQMGLDGRGGACYRRQLDAACYPAGRVRKIVWEGCRCLTHWALELDDGSSESPSQVAGRNWRNCAGEAHLDGDEYILGMTQYGGGYCNFYGGWGRRFDFFTNKRTVNVKAPGKPQLHVASEIARRAVTVSRTKEGGKFFLFHKSEWLSIFGLLPSQAPVKTRVKQLRQNEIIWEGEVVVWGNSNGLHGRRSHEGEPGQWQLSDLLVPFAGPDAGAIDFLLSNRASAVVGSFLAVSEQDVKSKEGVVNLEEKVQFSMRLQPGKQILGPFVGPVAGLYPEGRVTQVGLADVCVPEPPVAPRNDTAGNQSDEVPQAKSVVTPSCGGTGGGAACKFPFEFNGKTYESCTKEGHDRPWCFTVAGDNTWGNCDCSASLISLESATSTSVAAKKTRGGSGGKFFEYALLATSTRSADAGYSSCWDIGEIQFFSDRMCRNQITVNSRSISVSTYEDGLQTHEYKEISKDMLCRAGADGQWYLGGRRSARGGLYDSLDACKDLCTTERSCTFFGYRAKDGRCEFFTAFGDCENKMGGAPGFAMYKKLKPLQTATAHQVSCAKMALLPVKKGSMEARCRSGNDLGDGFEYIFNVGAGTSAAACGEASTCECCMRPKKAEDGPWPVASKSNTRCKVLDVIAKVGVNDVGECQSKAVDAGHAFFSLFDVGGPSGRKECLTSATCTLVQEARGWRVYGRHPAGQQEAFGRGSAALGIAQGVSEWTEIAEPSLAISKLVDGLDVTPLRAWGRQAVWVRAEVPGEVGCIKVFQSAAELSGCRPSAAVQVKRRAGPGAAWMRLATAVWPSSSPSWIRIGLADSRCVGTKNRELPRGFSAPSKVPVLAPLSIADIFRGAAAGDWGPAAEGKHFIAVTTYPKKDGSQGLRVLFGDRYPQTAPAVNLPLSDCQFGGVFGTGSMPLLQARKTRQVSWPGATWKIYEGPMTVSIDFGHSDENVKCVDPDEAAACDAEAGNHRGDDFPDRFTIFDMDGQICAKRGDEPNASWTSELRLIISCKSASEAARAPVAEVGQLLGSPGSSLNCTASDAPAFCSAEAGDDRYDAFPAKYLTYSTGSEVCAVATQSPVPAQLATSCMAPGLAAVKDVRTAVVIGSGVDDLNQKCTMPPMPVACDREAATHRKDPFSHRFDVVPLPGGQICAVLTHAAPDSAKRAGPMLLAEGSQGSGKTVAGNRWLQGRKTFSGVRGSQEMCGPGDSSGTYLIRIFIEQGARHQVGVASRACCDQSTQSGNGTQLRKNFAALASVPRGWEAQRGAATPAEAPGVSWFDGSWDGPRAVTMVVSCLKRSFTLGLDGGDDFLGEMLWPDTWGGVYTFVGGIDGDHIYRVEWAAAAFESQFRCAELPTEQGSDAERCLRGNELGDGQEYAFNLGESPNALCSGGCACCARKAVKGLGPMIRALDSFDFVGNGYWSNFRDGFSRIGMEYYLPVDAPGCESCARECLNYPDDACIAFNTDGGDCSNAANCMVYTELGTAYSHEITRAFTRKPASVTTTASPTTVTTTKAWDFELALSCSPQRDKVAFYSVGSGTCQDAQGREAAAASRPLSTRAGCEAHCEEMSECLGYFIQPELCTLYLSSNMDIPDGWSLEANLDSTAFDIVQGSGTPADANCMKKGLHYCGWTPKPSTGTPLNCGLDSPDGDGCSHSSCIDVLACQAACDRCTGCVGFSYQALSDSGVRCYMKGSWTHSGRDFVSLAPDSASWQSYVNARHGACAATQRTVHYCGWTKQIARSAVPLDCGLQSPGGEGCSTEACPDLASCKARCSACRGCIGFEIMEQGNGGYRCWMRSAWEHDTDYQSSNPDNSSWHPYVNERDDLCNQDPSLQQLRGQVLKHVEPMPGQKEEGDERASTCLRSQIDLQTLPRGAYTLYAEVKLQDAAGGQVITWGANGDEGRAASPCLKAHYWGLAAVEASANGYYEPFYLDFFESADGTGESLPADEVYIQGLISPGVQITQSNRGRHFLQYKPNQQNWGVSWTEHQVPLIYRDLGSAKVIRSARHAARPNHVPQEAVIVASNDGIVWYARFRATGDSARELINQPVQCKDPLFVPEPEEGSEDEVLPMRKHMLVVGGDSVKSFWGRNPFEGKLNKSLVDEKWHSIMSTFDGVTQKLWVDHALLAIKQAKNFLSVLQTSNFCVGSREDGEKAFPGELRNVQIFSEAKMPGSIQADMNLAVVGTASMSSSLNVGTEGALNDGSLDSRAISVDEKSPWAQVDLGSPMPVGRIHIENSDADQCASRLFLGTECSWDYDIGNYSAADQGANIGISMTPCEGDICGGVICTRITGSNQNGTGQTYAGDCQGRYGRYVYVQLPGPSRILDLRELRVFKASSAASAGETVLCADRSSSCAGDVCCRGFEATGFKTYPCPSAHDTFMKCQVKTKVVNALANVSRQESDDQLEENLTLNATVAAAPEGRRIFVPMDGGVGRACRGAHREDWRGSYVVKHRGRSLEMCKLICRSHPLCQGIEYNDDCEMWVRAEGIGSSVAYEGPARFSTCLRLLPQDLAPETRFTSQQGRKCRTKPYTMDQTAGCNGWKGLTIEGCKDKCRMNSIAEKCPAKLCAAAVFFTNSGFCHLYDECEETEPDRSALLLHREVTALQTWPGLVAKGEECNPNPGMFDFGAGPQSFSILAQLSNVKLKKIQGQVQGPILSKLSTGRGKSYWSDARGWEFGVVYDRKCRCRLLRFFFRTASGHTFFGYGTTPLTGAEVEVAMSFDAKDFTTTMWVNGKEEKVAQRPQWYRTRFAGDFSSRAKLTIGRRSGGSRLFDGQLFNVVLYRGVLEDKDFGVEVTTLKYQFVGVGRTLSEDWIQVRTSLLEEEEADSGSGGAAEVGNWSEAVPCKGCSRYTEHRVGGVCQYDKSKTTCAVCMPPHEGVFNCQCGRRFPHTCAPCGKEELCSSLANEPPLELGRATMNGVSFQLNCQSSGTVQLQAQVVAPYGGSDVFYLSMGSCPSWRWFLHSGWGTNCAEDDNCAYQDEPRWTVKSEPCKLREGKHFVTFRPSHPGDIKLTRLRLTSGSDFCTFEPLPPAGTTTTTTYTTPPYLQGACPSEAEEATDFNNCPFRYYVLEVLSTAGDEAAWKIGELRLYYLNARGRLRKFPSSDVRAELVQDDAETRGCEASNASNAFDLSVFSGLCSPSPMIKLRLDLGRGVSIAKYTVISANASSSFDPKSWRLWGSVDGATASDMTSLSTAVKLSDVSQAYFPSARWMCDPPWGVPRKRGYHCMATTTTTTTEVEEEIIATTTTTTATIKKDRCFYRYYALQVLQANDAKATSWQLAEVELRQNGKALLLPKSRGSAWFVHGRARRPGTVLDDGTEAFNVLDGNLATVAQPDGGFSANYTSVQLAFGQRVRVARSSSTFDYAEAHFCMDADEDTRCSTAWNGGSGELNPWWQVDLGIREAVEIVALLSHPDGCEARYGVDVGDKCTPTGAVVSVSDVSCAGHTCPGEPCGKLEVTGKDNWYYVSCEGKVGRYVQVQLKGQRVLNDSRQGHGD